MVSYVEWRSQVNVVVREAESLSGLFSVVEGKYRAGVVDVEGLRKAYIVAKGLLDVSNILILIGETFEAGERGGDYEQLMRRLREVKNYAEGVIDFVRKVIGEV